MRVRDQPYNIAELIDDLETRKISLPTLQRDFRWSNNQIAYFFDSIYQERPLGGQFHLWRPQDGDLKEVNDYSRAISSTDKYSKTKNSKTSEYFIIDGQQRLTSLKKVFEGEVKLYFDPLTESFHLPNQYRNSKVYDSKILDDKGKLKNAEFVSVKELWEQSKVIDVAYSKSFSHYGDKLEFIIDNLKKLAFKLRRLNFNCIVLDGHSEEQITEIFIILNNAGKQVNTKESVLFPLLIQSMPGIRKEIDDFINVNFKNDDSNSISSIFDSNFIATALMYHMSNGYNSNISSFKKKLDADKIENSLSVVKEGILKTVDFLKSSFGITTKNMISTHFSLYVLVLAFGQKIVLNKAMKTKESTFFTTAQIKGAKLYFLTSNAFRRYSDANSDANRKNDIKLSMDSNAFEALGKSMLIHKKSGLLNDTWFSKEDLKNVEYGGRKGKHHPLLKTLGIACYLKDAWKLTDGDEKLDLSRAQQHHIFPYSVYQEQDNVHNIANIAIVDKDANMIKFKKREPFDYINDNEVLDDDQRKNLHNHLIPMNENNKFNNMDFDSFISERSRLIAEELSNVFKRCE